MLEAVVGVQRGRNLHRAHHPNPSRIQPTALRGCRLATRAPTTGNADAAGKNTYVVQSGYGTAVADGDPNAAARTPSSQPGAGQCGEGPDGADPQRLVHGRKHRARSRAYRALSHARCHGAGVPTRPGTSRAALARAGRIAPRGREADPRRARAERPRRDLGARGGRPLRGRAGRVRARSRRSPIRRPRSCARRASAAAT